MPAPSRTVPLYISPTFSFNLYRTLAIRLLLWSRWGSERRLSVGLIQRRCQPAPRTLEISLIFRRKTIHQLQKTFGRTPI